MQQTVEFINISLIDFGERYRKDYGDLTELAESLKTNGIISSFAVQKVEGTFQYKLLAGGRRFKAAEIAGITRVPAIVYLDNLTNLQVREIELMENLHRKDFHWSESVELTEAIHKLKTEIHGTKTVGGPNVKGHSERDTAKMLNRSPSSVNEDLNLAKVMTTIPEIKNFKSKSDAITFVKKAKRNIAAENVKKRIEIKATDVGIAKIHEILINYYNIVPRDTNPLKSGVFSAFPKLVDEIADMVILDMPYALGKDVSSEISDRSVVSTEGDTWITMENYIPTLDKLLSEAYRLLKPNSWLIVWFGPEPWFEPTYQAILRADFKCSRNVGLWVKNKGFSHYPTYYLGNAHESFFYARKGRPIIKHQEGKTNLFRFSVPHHTVRIHQTEKPVELEQEIMTTFLDEGAVIVVPCLGSGNRLLRI